MIKIAEKISNVKIISTETDISKYCQKKVKQFLVNKCRVPASEISSETLQFNPRGSSLDSAVRWLAGGLGGALVAPLSTGLLGNAQIGIGFRRKKSDNIAKEAEINKKLSAISSFTGVNIKREPEGILTKFIVSEEAIEFTSGSAEIQNCYYPLLNKFVNFIRNLEAENRNYIVIVNGHTDNIGDEEYNNKLSLARAQSIVDYFIRRDLPYEKLFCYGYGETKPIASNATESGRMKNRRVEILIEEIPEEVVKGF